MNTVLMLGPRGGYMAFNIRLGGAEPKIAALIGPAGRYDVDTDGYRSKLLAFARRAGIWHTDYLKARW